MPWIIGGAALGGALISADAVGKAGGDQGAATARGIGEQRREFDVTRSDQAPYRDLGTSAIAKLRSFFGMPGGDAALESDPRYKEIYDRNYGAADAAHQARYGMPLSASSDPGGLSSSMDAIKRAARDEFQQKYPNFSQEQQAAPDFGNGNRAFSINDFWQDPVTQLGYQSGLDLGTKALYNASPLTTGRDSGAALKELTKFGQDYAGSKAGDSQARFEGNKSNVFNRLMAMIGGGQVSNQVTAGAGTNMANNVSNLVSGQGNADAAARIGQANAFTGALGNISNWWQQSSLVNRLFPKSGTGTYVGPLGYNPQPE
jgi:hypothetical protein